VPDQRYLSTSGVVALLRRSAAAYFTFAGPVALADGSGIKRGDAARLIAPIAAR
jgi:hypothetical protein